VGACSPTDFINGFTTIFFGVTCDHSLGGSQVFTMFPMSLFVKLMLPGVPDSANPPKFGSLPLAVRKPAKNSKVNGAKDAQKGIGGPCKIC
jgi:hypothetical protein